MAQVDLVRGPFLHRLRDANGAEAVHVRFGTVVRHVAVAVAEIVEVVARRTRLVDGDLAISWRIELAHRFVQDRRHVRFIDEIGHFGRRAEMFTLLRSLDATERGLDEIRGYRTLQDDVPVSIEGPFLGVGKGSWRCVHDASLAFSMERNV